MAKYAIIVEDTEDGQVRIEVGGMTPESVNPEELPEMNRTQAMSSVIVLASTLRQAADD